MARWRRTVGVAAVACALGLLAPAVGVAASGPAPIRVSADPYRNPSSVHATEVEPDSFAWGSTVVSAFQVGRFYNGGASNVGWATTTNGGRSWTHGFLPHITRYAGGPYDRVSDTAVAYDPAHRTWLVSYLAIVTTGHPSSPIHTDLLVSRSPDGTHWQTPVVVRFGGRSSFLDKNWTACDTWRSSRFYGRCYSEWDDAALGNLVQMSISADGGKTWTRPRTAAGRPSVIGGVPVVQPDGTVVVPIIVFTHNFTVAVISALRSTDGGRTWNAPTPIARSRFRHPDGNIRAGLPLPTAEVDRTGRVYVTWADCRYEPGCTANDLLLATSTNGRVWSAPQRIPLDPVGSGVDHFVPGLAVDPTTAGRHTHLALAYYYYPDATCTPDSCQLTVGYSNSSDGGATWTPGRPLTTPMKPVWLPLTTQGYMFGDYISTSFTPGDAAYPFFSAAQPPTGSTLHDAIYTAKLPVAAEPTRPTDTPAANATTPQRTFTTASN